MTAALINSSAFLEYNSISHYRFLNLHLKLPSIIIDKVTIWK